MKEKQFLFVYGSLKKGFRNHRYLKDGQYPFTYEGPAITVGSFAMKGNGYYPVVFRDENIASVLGELYSFSADACLSRVDQLEGHPTFYQRTPETVETFDGNRIVAWMYAMEREPVDWALNTRGVRLHTTVKNKPILEWVKTID